MGDRGAILGCSDAEELFGTVEPRALRRAYAALARAWRDDPEVAAHLKAVFDTARRPPAPTMGVEEEPSGFEGLLRQAVESGDPHLLVQELTFGYRLLVERVPALVRRALDVVVHAHGEALDAQERLGLVQILRDPLVEFGPATEHALLQALGTLDELERLEADATMPAAVAACLQRSWGHRPPQVARCWLEAAQALARKPKRPIFTKLEQQYPACFGRWVWLETMVTDAGSASPVEAPLDPALVLAYTSNRAREQRAADAAWRRIWGRVPVLGGADTRARWALALLGLVLVVSGAVLTEYASTGSDASGRTVNLVVFVVGGLVAVPFLAHAGLWWNNVRVARAASDGGALKPLFDEARRTARFPRELTRELHDRPPLSRQVRGYEENHAVLRLARCPWALLEVITEAHVDRLETR